METKKEMCRVKEADSSDFENPELREIDNDNMRILNKVLETKEQFEEGKISVSEVNKFIRQSKKERMELQRRLKEYKKRQNKS